MLRPKNPRDYALSLVADEYICAETLLREFLACCSYEQIWAVLEVLQLLPEQLEFEDD